MPGYLLFQEWAQGLFQTGWQVILQFTVTGYLPDRRQGPAFQTKAGSYVFLLGGIARISVRINAQEVKNSPSNHTRVLFHFFKEQHQNACIIKMFTVFAELPPVSTDVDEMLIITQCMVK